MGDNPEPLEPATPRRRLKPVLSGTRRRSDSGDEGDDDDGGHADTVDLSADRHFADSATDEFYTNLANTIGHSCMDSLGGFQFRVTPRVGMISIDVRFADVNGLRPVLIRKVLDEAVGAYASRYRCTYICDREKNALCVTLERRAPYPWWRRCSPWDVVCLVGIVCIFAGVALFLAQLVRARRGDAVS